MKNFKNVLAVVLFLMGATLFAQTNLTGKVVDDYNQPLPGADVIVKGTTQGTSTDFDGNFNLDTSNASGTVTISFIGYTSKNLAFTGSKDFGTVQLEASSESLDEVVIVGVADIAKDRETPVAVSTIKATEIIERLGSQEFPEILKSTPSVYATKQGGGFGDSRINIRGFDQRNTAVMINGMPVNDMENGWVYWSNWAGLSDVTTAMQVQRGLGSSKLAIASVGGTINVLTNSSQAKEGGAVSATYGNDNYLKTIASYNTGRMDSGFSTSVLLGRTSGDGYVEGTPFEGYNYYLAFGYSTDKSDIQLTITGAPQEHFQRGYANPISEYLKYGEDEVDPNIKYNSDWGWRDGEIATFSGNFYHKPIASLNWDIDLGLNSKLSNVLYASYGRGGSIGSIGRINGGKSYYSQFKDAEGHVRFDDIIAWNAGGTNIDFGNYSSGDREGYTGGGNAMYQGMHINGNQDSYGFESDGGHVYGGENGISQRSSMNSHNWFGLITNFNTSLNDNLTLDLGFDLRSYKGIHYRRLVDLLGADAYVGNDNINETYRFITEKDTYKPEISNILNVFANIDDEVKIDYYNDGNVRWEGVFGQLEYKNENISAFLQAAGSYQQFQRVDYFNYLDSDSKQASDWINILGGNVKGGLNFNINEKHNVFVNGGYFSKQPGFDAIFLNYVNDVNEDYQNEKVIGVELGYGFRSERASIKVNLYHTTWSDRFMRFSDDFDLTPNDPDDDDVRGVANILGVKENHMGVEFEMSYRPLENLTLKGMVGVGDWIYDSTVSARYFDEGDNPIILPGETEAKDETLYLEGVKVGDAAQFTSRLGMNWEAFKNFNVDMSQFFADKLYADIDASAFTDEVNNGSLQLPSYSLTDVGVSYKFNLGNEMGIKLRFNVNNLWDQIYISEANSNVTINNQSNFVNSDGTPDEPAYETYLSNLETYKGVDQKNNVFFGFGRTWNASIRFSF